MNIRSLLLLALAIARPAYSQSGLEGHWEGALAVPNREIGLSLDLAKDTKGEWIASMGLPAQNLTGLVVMDCSVKGKSVKFVAVELMMAKFELTLGENGVLKGTISSPQGPAPISFKRTGDAKVQAIPPSPAVSKELEGDWEGVLQGPGISFRMVFHFRNQADQTVFATFENLDGPGGNGMRFSLNDVKQSGASVEFGMRIAHGSFKGSLNPEGTELAGQYTHDASSVPMTLRKK